MIDRRVDHQTNNFHCSSNRNDGGIPARKFNALSVNEFRRDDENPSKTLLPAAVVGVTSIKDFCFTVCSDQVFRTD